VSLGSREIAQALDNGSFHPHFQPLVQLRTGDLHGFELLARWKHPSLGWIQADEFIPLAEQDGWIDRLSRELFHKAFSAMAALPSSLTLSVNISPIQLRNPRLPLEIQEIARKTGFALDRLTVEITESALTDEPANASAVSEAIKAFGCKLSLDDFGTGYSSLTKLQSLPFDEIKVDRSFVSSMTERRDSRKIVAAVVGLGQSLGLVTVAEGVETLEQGQMLRWLGCDLVQGWLYGQAQPAEELPNIVANFRRREFSASPLRGLGRASSGSADLPPAVRLAQLQAVYDGAPVGLAFVDRDLRYRMLNRRLAQMNGQPMEAHLGEPVSTMIPEIFPIVEGYIRRALKGEAIPSVEITKPARGVIQETTIMLSYEPARDEAGEVLGVSVAIVDVTATRLAEKAYREADENFRQMIELLPQIPWIIDPEGRALDVSQRWMEITGMRKDQWRGFGWLDALHPDDLQPTMDALKSSFESGMPIDVIYRVRRSEADAWTRIRSRGAARFGANGQIICWYGSLEEVA
jgi:PAS domain S-box-containing protein